MHITGFKKYCRFESTYPQLWSVCSRSYCDYKKRLCYSKQWARFPLEHTCRKSSCCCSRLFTEISRTEPLMSTTEVPVMLRSMWAWVISGESEVRIPCTQSVHHYHSATWPWSWIPHSMMYYSTKQLQLTNYQQLMRPFPHPLSGKKSTLQKENNSKIY